MELWFVRQDTKSAINLAQARNIWVGKVTGAEYNDPRKFGVMATFPEALKTPIVLYSFETQSKAEEFFMKITTAMGNRVSPD